MQAQQIFWQNSANFCIKGLYLHPICILLAEMTLYILTLIYIFKQNNQNKMGAKDFMGSELIFSDTVHQFLQVLTLSR